MTILKLTGKSLTSDSSAIPKASAIGAMATIQLSYLTLVSHYNIVYDETREFYVVQSKFFRSGKFWKDGVVQRFHRAAQQPTGQLDQAIPAHFSVRW